jgi:hypothetical protein
MIPKINLAQVVTQIAVLSPRLCLTNHSHGEPSNPTRTKASVCRIAGALPIYSHQRRTIRIVITKFKSAGMMCRSLLPVQNVRNVPGLYQYPPPSPLKSTPPEEPRSKQVTMNQRVANTTRVPTSKQNLLKSRLFCSISAEKRAKTTTKRPFSMQSSRGLASEQQPHTAHDPFLTTRPRPSLAALHARHSIAAQTESAQSTSRGLPASKPAFHQAAAQSLPAAGRGAARKTSPP